MALFKKKKAVDEELEEEYEDDESEEEIDERRTKRFTKKLKDLNPEDRKKRKEPPKPWGKKERLLVLSLILLTAGTSGYLALSARDYKLPGLPRLMMPSFSMTDFFGQETIVIEGNSMNKKEEEKAVKMFNDKTEKLSGVWGLYVVRLNDNSSYGVNENETFEAASLIKLPVMAGMYREAEEGRLRLDDKYRLKNSDKVAGAGSLYNKPAGYEITYRNLIKLMGKESDNTAFNISRKFLGEEKIAEVMSSIGMEKTSLTKNETTPEDIGMFFSELWQGNVLNGENKTELLSFLTDTAYENWLAAGIPEEVRVAHKYGREVHVVNDAGVIFSEDPFVVVILSKGVVERDADRIFPELSKIVYDSESN